MTSYLWNVNILPAFSYFICCLSVEKLCKYAFFMERNNFLHMKRTSLNILKKMKIQTMRKFGVEIVGRKTLKYQNFLCKQ